MTSPVAGSGETSPTPSEQARKLVRDLENAVMGVLVAESSAVEDSRRALLSFIDGIESAVHEAECRIEELEASAEATSRPPMTDLEWREMLRTSK